MKIIPFSYKDQDLYYSILKPYRLAKDYKYLFSSKEWILAYMKIYKPTNNYLFISGKNYFILSEMNGLLGFCGGEFNDFNGVNNLDSITKFNINSIFHNMKKIKFPLIFTNIFENSLKAFLDSNLCPITKTQSISITRCSGESFTKLISSRIRKMYFKHKDKMTFQRIYAKDFSKHVYEEINYMLKLRQEKFTNFHQKNRNLSFSDDFNDFIKRIISNKDIEDNFFIDVSYQENIPVGMSWNFIHTGNVICYLRSHAVVDNRISNGLILDYWSALKNDEEDIVKWDFTRGTEGYKYRLGGIQYFLSNYKIS